LSLTVWESIFSTDDIDKITTDISNTILSAAEATIPNKFVTIRKQDLAWLHSSKSPWLYNQILRLNDLLTGLGAIKKPMTGQW
jgi:hypothetical protein